MILTNRPDKSIYSLLKTPFYKKLFNFLVIHLHQHFITSPFGILTLSTRLLIEADSFENRNQVVNSTFLVEY